MTLSGAEAKLCHVCFLGLGDSSPGLPGIGTGCCLLLDGLAEPGWKRWLWIGPDTQPEQPNLDTASWPLSLFCVLLVGERSRIHGVSRGHRNIAGL